MRLSFFYKSNNFALLAIAPLRRSLLILVLFLGDMFPYIDPKVGSNELDPGIGVDTFLLKVGSVFFILFVLII